MQKILGGPSGSIGSVGGGSDTAGSKTGATEPVTPAPVSPARIGDGPGEQRTGAQSPPVMMSPEMLKTILAESMAMGMQIAGASAEKQAKEQTTPGGSLSESALSGASAGTPRLHAARTLDYLLEGYLKKADRMDFKAGLPSPELQLQDRLQATVTYCNNIRAEMRVNGMAHWFELDPAVTSGLELEEALTLTLNGKHVGKHGLRMHYVNDHKQAVSVQLAFKLQSAVVACAAADTSYASLHLLVNEDAWPMLKVGQHAEPFELMLESITQHLLYGKGAFMVNEAAHQFKLSFLAGQTCKLQSLTEDGLNKLAEDIKSQLVIMHTLGVPEACPTARELFKTLPVFFSELFNGGKDDEGVFKCVQYYAWLGEACNPDQLWSKQRSVLSRDEQKVKEIRETLVNGWELRLPQKNRYFPAVIAANSGKPCALATFFEWLRSKVQSESHRSEQLALIQGGSGGRIRKPSSAEAEEAAFHRLGERQKYP